MLSFKHPLSVAKGLAASLLALALVPAFLGSSMEPATAQASGGKTETAIFAGGCFWCIEKDFDHVPGVLETISGYSGGTTDKNVTYKNHVAASHREVLKVTYDPSKVSYDKLLDIFWRSVDPTDGGGQFCDRGHSYTTAIYTLDAEQAKKAAASKAKLEEDKILARPIQTEIAPAAKFFAAEDYHQDFYQKNPIRYKYYRYSCGRNARVQQVWGDQAYQGIKQ